MLKNLFPFTMFTFFATLLSSLLCIQVLLLLVASTPVSCDSSRAAPFNIAWFSDVFLDLAYGTADASFANEAGLVCGNASLAPALGVVGCSCPAALWTRFVAQAVNQSSQLNVAPDLVLLTGNSFRSHVTPSSHDVVPTPQYSGNVTALFAETFQNISDTLAGAFYFNSTAAAADSAPDNDADDGNGASSRPQAFVVALGPHDLVPPYTYDFRNVSSSSSSSSLSSSWTPVINNNSALLSLAADSFYANGMLSRKSAKRFATLGFYSEALPQFPLTVLSLNTVVWSRELLPVEVRELRDSGAVPDPLGQFAWLENELATLNRTNRWAVIIGSVPPGVRITFSYDTVESAPGAKAAYSGYYSDAMLARYSEIVTRYSSVIAGQLFGTTQHPQLRVLNQTTLVYSTGAVSPRENDPSMSLVQIDLFSGQLLNWHLVNVDLKLGSTGLQDHPSGTWYNIDVLKSVLPEMTSFQVVNLMLLFGWLPGLPSRFEDFITRMWNSGSKHLRLDVSNQFVPLMSFVDDYTELREFTCSFQFELDSPAYRVCVGYCEGVWNGGGAVGSGLQTPLSIFLESLPIWRAAEAVELLFTVFLVLVILRGKFFVRIEFLAKKQQQQSPAGGSGAADNNNNTNTRVSSIRRSLPASPSSTTRSSNNNNNLDNNNDDGEIEIHNAIVLNPFSITSENYDTLLAESMARDATAKAAAAKGLEAHEIGQAALWTGIFAVLHIVTSVSLVVLRALYAPGMLASESLCWFRLIGWTAQSVRIVNAAAYAVQSFSVYYCLRWSQPTFSSEILLHMSSLWAPCTVGWSVFAVVDLGVRPDVMTGNTVLGAQVFRCFATLLLMSATWRMFVSQSNARSTYKNSILRSARASVLWLRQYVTLVAPSHAVEASLVKSDIVDHHEEQNNHNHGDVENEKDDDHRAPLLSPNQLNNNGNNNSPSYGAAAAAASPPSSATTTGSTGLVNVVFDTETPLFSSDVVEAFAGNGGDIPVAPLRLKGRTTRENLIELYERGRAAALFAGSTISADTKVIPAWDEAHLQFVTLQEEAEDSSQSSDRDASFPAPVDHLNNDDAAAASKTTLQKQEERQHALLALTAALNGAITRCNHEHSFLYGFRQAKINLLSAVIITFVAASITLYTTIIIGSLFRKLVEPSYSKIDDLTILVLKFQLVRAFSLLLAREVFLSAVSQLLARYNLQSFPAFALVASFVFFFLVPPSSTPILASYLVIGCMLASSVVMLGNVNILYRKDIHGSVVKEWVAVGADELVHAASSPSRVPLFFVRGLPQLLQKRFTLGEGLTVAAIMVSGLVVPLVLFFVILTDRSAAAGGIDTATWICFVISSAAHIYMFKPMLRERFTGIPTKRYIRGTQAPGHLLLSRERVDIVLTMVISVFLSYIVLDYWLQTQAQARNFTELNACSFALTTIRPFADMLAPLYLESIVEEEPVAVAAAAAQAGGPKRKVNVRAPILFKR